MAFTTISLTNGVEIKEAPLGFSWTTFFFGFFPALIRGDWIMAVVLLLLGMITWGISGIVFAFIYNKMYAKSLLNKGWIIHALPNGITEAMVCRELGMINLPNLK